MTQINHAHRIGPAAHAAVNAVLGNSTASTSTRSSAGSSSSTSASATGTSAIPANQQITESGFLTLISTQLKEQDPMNPTDPTQFVTQIEGLSQVSSLQSLQTSMNSLTTSMQSTQLLNGSLLLGQTVLAPGSSGTIANGGTLAAAVNAPTGATSLQVSITDANGNMVNSFAVAPQSSGMTNFQWNGTTSSGAAAPAGTYNVNVSAVIGNKPQLVNTLIQSTVNSVTMDPTTNTLDLNTNNGSIPLSSVVSLQ